MAETPKSSDTPKKTGSWWSKNWFYTVLITVALLGGVGAFWIPFWPSQPFSAGDSISTLRQAILAATGGVLAILTLWETRRKNDQEHTRQVHAERRSRYATAIEQLADEKAPIRLGGVYTLVKLVDDWLADKKTLPSEDERRQEGQIIIDSLCAYIRSSFPLAERHDELTLSYEEYQQKYQGKNQAIQSVKNSADNSTPKAEKHQDDKQSNQSHEEFVHDKSLFREEKEVRQTILSEIKKRLNGGEVKRENGKNEIKPGTWSYFEYDFLNTVFFYRVGFRNSYFGASLNFSGVEFTEDANFSWAKFAEKANFSGAKFTEDAKFSWAEFTQAADFSEATFTWNANFSGAKFTKGADFSEAEFTKNADFSGAKFTKGADFSEAKFTKNADFSRAKFTGDADFVEATFTQNANFFEATFEEKPIFEYELYIETLKAKFSHRANPEDYNFKVWHNSPYKIETEEQEHNGTKFTIPKGTELFDPDEPSEQDNNDDN